MAHVSLLFDILSSLLIYPRPIFTHLVAIYIASIATSSLAFPFVKEIWPAMVMLVTHVTSIITPLALSFHEEYIFKKSNFSNNLESFYQVLSDESNLATFKQIAARGNFEFEFHIFFITNYLL